MTSTPEVTISHVVLHCFDLDRMVDFYTRIMNLHVTDRGVLGGPKFAGARMVFLSSDPRDHHQLALAEDRSGDTTGNLLHHVSYRHATLARLRELRDAVEEEGIGAITPANHGTHWSIYFTDPDGNQIEAFVDTPFYVHQPMWKPFDLTQSDAEILLSTEEMFHDDPSFRPLADWKADFAGEVGVEATPH